MNYNAPYKKLQCIVCKTIMRSYYTKLQANYALHYIKLQLYCITLHLTTFSLLIPTVHRRYTVNSGY